MSVRVFLSISLEDNPPSKECLDCYHCRTDKL